MPVISIRVSDEWLSYVDAEAERCRWKRNAAVVNLTWDGLQVRGALDKEKRDAQCDEVSGREVRPPTKRQRSPLERGSEKSVSLVPSRGESSNGDEICEGSKNRIETKPTCPRCEESKSVVPWGSGHRCQECKVNF